MCCVVTGQYSNLLFDIHCLIFYSNHLLLHTVIHKYYLLNSFTHLMRFSYGSFILIVRINSQVKRDSQPLSQGKRITGARRSFYTESMSSRGFCVTYFSPRQGRGKLFFNICTYFARNLYSMGADCDACIVYLKSASWDRDAIQELLLA